MRVSELIEELRKFPQGLKINTEVTRHYFNVSIGRRTYHFDNKTGDLDGWSDFVYKPVVVLDEDEEDD